jgi:hypothetical protein
MDIFSLLYVIHRHQHIKILDGKTAETIYEGNKFHAPCTGMEVKEIFIDDYALVIKVERM